MLNTLLNDCNAEAGADLSASVEMQASTKAILTVLQAFEVFTGSLLSCFLSAVILG